MPYYYTQTPTVKTTCIGNALSSFNYNFSSLDNNMYELSNYTTNSVNYLSSSIISVSANLTNQISGTSALLFNHINYLSANTVNNYIAQGVLYTPTGGGTVNWNFTTVGTNAKMYLTGNVILANPTGLFAGQSGNLVVELSTTNGYKISAFGDKWKFANSLSSMNTAASAVNLIRYYYDGKSLLSTMLSAF